MSSTMDAHNTNYETTGNCEVICKLEGQLNLPLTKAIWSNLFYWNAQKILDDLNTLWNGRILEQAERKKWAPKSDFLNILESNMLLRLVKPPSNDIGYEIM